jgi:ribonuclease-3
MITPEMTQIQQLLSYWWQDPSLLRQALVHSSYGNSFGEPHSERLEFLGDSVLDLVTAEWLMAQYPDADEGFMSRSRADMVQEGALVHQAYRIGLDRALIVKPGNQYLRDVRSVLADAFEAVIGAMYRDCGSLHTVRQGLLNCGFFV